MSRKEMRKNRTFVGKSLYRQIREHQMPDPDRDIIMHTKYGKEYLGVYRHPKFYAYVPGNKKFISFGRTEITKWEYAKTTTDKEEDNGQVTEAPIAEPVITD